LFERICTFEVFECINIFKELLQYFQKSQIPKTPDPLLSLVLLRDKQRLSLGELLTVTNYYYKPSTKHEKGHISTFNIELGFKPIKFHRFW
jgi:hypothetical protein